jgi:cytochrome c-type biogenesis protein CcmH/NrfG
MIEDWIVVICGVVAIVVVMTVTLLKLRSAERRMHESTYKLKVYTDLLPPVILTRWISQKRTSP